MTNTAAHDKDIALLHAEFLQQLIDQIGREIAEIDRIGEQNWDVSRADLVRCRFKLLNKKMVIDMETEKMQGTVTPPI